MVPLHPVHPLGPQTPLGRVQSAVHPLGPLTINESRCVRRNNVKMERQNSSGLASYDPLFSECSASRRRPAAASVVLRVANDECSALRRKRRV